ncbi:isochorismatase family cysteine hydrolase [Mycoplasma crocodyli]|uniref:isochorismatase family cysteine hydrolase n=1 Tax=Mycoplasma crocodyli TaxID=50052 RepID=UPI0002E63674|nr:isochorismatase family cysteine hydrolase [Mycoplasma crocodyli]
MKDILIVIDMLNGFAKEGSLFSNNIKKIIPNIEKVLQVYNDNLFICDSHLESDIEMKCYPLHCLKGSDESEIVSELKPYVKNIQLKNSTNGFHLFDKSIIHKFDRFILAGCCTDICVLQFGISLKTYLNEMNINKDVVVLKDCVATFDLEGHNSNEFNEFALKLMNNSGIIIK